MGETGNDERCTERQLRLEALKIAADMREIETPTELVLKCADLYLAWLKAGRGH